MGLNRCDHKKKVKEKKLQLLGEGFRKEFPEPS